MESKPDAVPPESHALLYGGWRLLPADPSEAKLLLKQSYTAFVSDANRLDSNEIGLKQWACITPERWTPCASYEHAVAMLRERGVGVVDLLFGYYHMDLCDEETFDQLEDAYDLNHEYSDEDKADADADADGKNYVVMTSLPPSRLADLQRTTIEDYRQFQKDNPSVIWKGL